MTSPVIAFDVLPPGPVIIPTSTSVIVAGGTTGPRLADQPSATALEWSRRSNAWRRLPDLPADYFGHMGATVGDTPVLVASYCPDVESIGDYTEVCRGDRILTLDPGARDWTVTEIPQSEDLSQLNTGWAGEVDDHTLGLTPESISHVGVLLYDLRSHEFSLRHPPDGPSDGPVASTACVSDGNVYLVAVGIGTPGRILVGPDSPPPTADRGTATLWAMAGDGWSPPAQLTTSGIGGYRELCSRGQLFFLGESGSFRVGSKNGTIETTPRPVAGLETLWEGHVARKGAALYGVSSDGELLAVTTPGAALPADEAVVTAAQYRDTIDVLTETRTATGAKGVRVLSVGVGA